MLWLDDLCVVCAWLPYLAVRAANNTLRHIWEVRLRLCKQHQHIVPVRRSSLRGLTSLSVLQRKGEPFRTCRDAANAATPPRTLLKSQTEISFATFLKSFKQISLLSYIVRSPTVLKKKFVGINLGFFEDHCFIIRWWWFQNLFRKKIAWSIEFLLPSVGNGTILSNLNFVFVIIFWIL